MNDKTRNIIGWVLSGLLGALFLFSAFGKLMGGAESLEQAAHLGISSSAFMTLGIVELLAVALFLIPRTGIVGSLLLIAYLGGAIATHLEHNESIMAPVMIEVVLWLTAAVRFPELTERLMGKR